MAYLDDHKPARAQQRVPRRDRLSGVIGVHTAENTPDFVAFDGGAEAVARFISTRTDAPGSYHVIVDSDSRVQVVDYGNEAFHDGTGTNRHSIGLSVATRADVWPLAPKDWRDGAVTQLAIAAADASRYIRAKTGIVVPARRITGEQARARVPGFVAHADLDPARRTDPGKAFPWGPFLEQYARLIGRGPTTPPKEDEDVKATLVRAKGDRTGAYWAITWEGRRWIRSQREANFLAVLGHLHSQTPVDLDRKDIESVPVVPGTPVPKGW